MMKRGYGKWLYQRRKLRFEDEVRFRRAIEAAVSALLKEPPLIGEALYELEKTLEESRVAEYELGLFEPEKE